MLAGISTDDIRRQLTLVSQLGSCVNIIITGGVLAGLEICGSNISDLRFLERCFQIRFQPIRVPRFVRLVRCPRVTDLRPLRGAHTVCLFRCPGVCDLRPLRESHTVRLNECEQICDLTPLINCRKVTLGGLVRVVDVSPLRRVRSVSVTACPGADMSVLSDVHSLWSNKAVPGVHYDITLVSPVTDDRSIYVQNNCYRLTADYYKLRKLRSTIPASVRIRHFCVSAGD